MQCRHRSLEVLSSNNINTVVRCIKCKEIIGEWTHEHLKERFDTAFGSFNIESQVSTFKGLDEQPFLRELTEEEREELR